MNKSIESSVINVLLRIIFFIVYYIFLIGCGFALFWLALKVTGWVFFDFLPSCDSINIRALLIGLFSFLVMWGVVGLFAIYLIKPIFSFTKNENPDRVEIYENDAPLLFKCLIDLAKETGCKRPKHVYLTTDVNACVFYNTSFWSIFFPVRKNLEIGLGLFQATDIEEVRSIIGHEFGHFTQGSMKVGSTVYVVNSILHNLVFEKDFFEEWLDELCTSDTSGWIRAWGSITRGITNIVKRMNVQVYKFVQRAYMGLSRQMEYDADNISAGTVGKDAFISAICKVEVLAQFHILYERFLQSLMSQGKTIGDYWTGYDIVKKQIAKDYSYTFNEKVLIDKPITQEAFPSKITFENVWDSHPDILKRLENVAICQKHSKTEGKSSWTLIPVDLKRKLSLHRLNQIAEELEGKLEKISEEDFESWVKTEIETFFIPLNLKPFLDREIIYFEEFGENNFETVENPFTEENAAILSEYETSINDWNLMNAFVNRQVEARHFTYNGSSYKVSNAPLEEHKSYTLALQEKAKRIDAQVFKYLLQQNENKNDIRYAYHCVFASSYVLPNVNQFAEHRDALVSKWNSTGGHTEDDFKSFLSAVNDMMDALKNFIKDNIDWQLLATVMNEDEIKEIQDFVEASRLSDYVGTEAVNQQFGFINKIGNSYQYMSRLGKHIIVQEAKKVV